MEFVLFARVHYKVCVPSELREKNRTLPVKTAAQAGHDQSLLLNTGTWDPIDAFFGQFFKTNKILESMLDLAVCLRLIALGIILCQREVLLLGLPVLVFY